MNLEKEIEKYYYDNFAFLSSVHIPTLTILSDIAKHFYRLGESKSISKDELYKWAIETKMALEKDCTIEGDFRKGAIYAIVELVTRLKTM